MFNEIYGVFMKTLGSVFIIICFFLFSSCKSNSSSPTDSGGLGGPGGGGGSVTFTITQQAGTQGGVFFSIAPSQAVVVKTINVSCTAAQVNDPYTDNTNTVYPANTPQKLNQEYLVSSGQKWVFVFTGNLGSTTGAAYNVTTNYTIP
jgi:hypothetical protein